MYNFPAYIKPLSNVIDIPHDSCFVPFGFLFPESRIDLAPYREFPLSVPFYSAIKKHDTTYEDIWANAPDESEDEGCFDSTILHISELDELLLDVQGTGTQYCLHTQMCLRNDIDIQFPNSWDKSQSLLLNIPVFSEELCQWHYAFSTSGYNIANVDPPLDIDVAQNYPQLFGYLPNGDLAVYWEIGEALADQFGLELDPIRSTVEGSLILLPNVPNQIKRNLPCDYAVDTGLVLAAHKDPTSAAQAAANYLGRMPTILKPASYQFYRIKLPVIQCEFDINLYAQATWGAFGYTCNRLAGFDFRIMNNPLLRQLPIFSTERGNIIISNDLYTMLAKLLSDFGVQLTARAFPIQRIS